VPSSRVTSASAKNEKCRLAVPTLTFGVLYCFFVIGHERRKILHFHDLTGGTITNSGLVPSNFQIYYAGNGNIVLTGGSASSAVVYAPNSSLKFSGGGDWFGAVICSQLTDTGGAAIHYDRQLDKWSSFVTNWMLDSFTWKKN
jgi:hypothetical protein